MMMMMMMMIMNDDVDAKDDDGSDDDDDYDEDDDDDDDDDADDDDDDDGAGGDDDDDDAGSYFLTCHGAGDVAWFGSGSRCHVLPPGTSSCRAFCFLGVCGKRAGGCESAGSGSCRLARRLAAFHAWVAAPSASLAACVACIAATLAVPACRKARMICVTPSCTRRGVHSALVCLEAIPLCAMCSVSSSLDR